MAKTHEQENACRDVDPIAAIHSEPLPLVTPADLVNPLLKVSDAMTAAPRTCSPASTALEAALVFRDADCGVIPVTDGGKPVGVITDREIALALADHEFDLARTPLSDLMTRDPITIESDAALGAAIDSLGEHGIRRLLVVDEAGHLTGILSWSDLVPHLSERGLGRAVSRIVEHR
jgi:CBS domain-containing protein